MTSVATTTVVMGQISPVAIVKVTHVATVLIAIVEITHVAIMEPAHSILRGNHTYRI
jgi:hypothetical protein